MVIDNSYEHYICFIYSFKKSLTHGILIQQVYRGLKNESCSPPVDTSNLQTMQDSNYYNYTLNIFIEKYLM